MKGIYVKHFTPYENLQLKYAASEAFLDAINEGLSFEERFLTVTQSVLEKYVDIAEARIKKEEKKMNAENERELLRQGNSYCYTRALEKEAEKGYKAFLNQARKGLALRVMDEAIKKENEKH